MLGLSLGLSNLYVYTGQCGRAALIMIADARLTVTLPHPPQLFKSRFLTLNLI